MKRDGTNDAKTKTGVCHFCGQTRMISLPEDEWLEMIRKTNKDADQLADDLATEQCTCNQGSEYRADHYVMEQCRHNIEDMFREEFEEIADLLQEAVPMVYYQHIKRVSITTPEHGVATMNRSGGNLKIKFTQKHETELTASY